MAKRFGGGAPSLRYDTYAKATVWNVTWRQKEEIYVFFTKTTTLQAKTDSKSDWLMSTWCMYPLECWYDAYRRQTTLFWWLGYHLWIVFFGVQISGHQYPVTVENLIMDMGYDKQTTQKPG